MANAMGRDLGGHVLAQHALNYTALTAGGAGDNTEVDGATLNLKGLVEAYGVRFTSALFQIAYEAALGANETLTGSLTLQDSADGTTWADVETVAAAMSVDNGSAATYRGVATYQSDVRALRDYVRIQFTPNLSRANTDTAKVWGIALLSGGDRTGGFENQTG